MIEKSSAGGTDEMDNRDICKTQHIQQSARETKMCRSECSTRSHLPLYNEIKSKSDRLYEWVLQIELK